MASNAEDRFDHAILIVLAAILPLCGVALIWVGVAGRVSPIVLVALTLLAIGGTVAAVHEIRAENRRRAAIARARKAKAAKPVANVATLPTWGERIKAANDEMGIHEPIRAHRRA